jgi:hypothetical protein
MLHPFFVSTKTHEGEGEREKGMDREVTRKQLLSWCVVIQSWLEGWAEQVGGGLNLWKETPALAQ